MMRQAGLSSDQTRVSREPQFLSKRKVPFYPPQVSHSLRWEGHGPSQPCQETNRPVTPPAVRDGSAGRPVTPQAPGDTTPSQNITSLSQLQAEPQTSRTNTSTADRSTHRRAPNGMCYNDNKAVPLLKSNPEIMESEYKSSFKASPHVRRDGEQHEISQPHTDNTNTEKRKRKKKRKERQLSSAKEEVPEFQQQEVRSPCAPRNPSPTIMRKMKTEYRSNFCSPLQYCCRDGVWVKARTAQVEDCEQNDSWYHEVQELREKADAYRKRAWGTHFSRQHLNQIISEQNWMWEPSSDTSSSSSVTSECCRTNSGTIIEALDLARAGSNRGSSSSGSFASVATSRRSSAGEECLPEGLTVPVRRRLAWDEEAGPERRNDVEISEELTHEKHQRNAKNIHEEINKRLQVLETDSAVVDGSRTSKLKTVQSVHRTHHDRITPATGGVPLVYPPKIKNSSPSVRRNESSSSKKSSSVIKNAIDGPSHEAENGRPPYFSPPSDLNAVDPSPMGEDAGSQKISQDLRQARPSHTLERQRPKMFVRPPANRIQGTMRNPEFQHNGDLGIFRPKLFPEFDFDMSDNEDKMSHISSRSAASCSVASQILDRAQRRKQEFWGES